MNEQLKYPGQNSAPEFNFEIAEKCLFLITEKARYKVLYGGRGGAKSWSIARALLIIAMQEYPDPEYGPCLIVCAREYMATIRDSVYRLIKQQIHIMGLTSYFHITDNEIRCLLTGATFVFKGIKRDPDGLRSLEGGKYWWLEEAHNVSQDSWEILTPTARRPGAEIWCSYNPHQSDDPTHTKFVTGLEIDPRAIVRKVNWRDNIWFTEELNLDRLHMLRTDPEAYDHVWEGLTKRVTDACIFRNKYEIRSFETPQWARLRFGADFGYAVSPNTLIRFWLGPPIDELRMDHPSHSTSCLYVDAEAYAVGVDLNVMQAFYERVPGSHKWPIKADGSRPETISYVLGIGFNISAAEKWPGSVEDGIAHLRGFDKIYVHEDCKFTAQEFRLYSYEVEEKTGLILPKIIKKHDHCIDAIRYGLDGFIQRRGGLGVWRKLANQARKR